MAGQVHSEMAIWWRPADTPIAGLNCGVVAPFVMACSSENPAFQQTPSWYYMGRTIFFGQVVTSVRMSRSSSPAMRRA